MAKHAADVPSVRAGLEKMLSVDLRSLTARSDRLGRYFARQHGMSSSDFHALLHIMVGESAGEPLTSTQLTQRMDVSPAAVTYLVDRMVDAGHIRREADPSDRRKSLLRYESKGMALSRKFFGPLGAQLRSAVAGLSDIELAAAHRVFTAMIDAMSDYEEQLRAREHGPQASRRERSRNGKWDQRRTVRRR